MKILSLSFVFIFCSVHFALSQQYKTEHVFIVTLDGMRWQEVFKGADSSIFIKKKYVKNVAEVRNKFWSPKPDSSRKLLMPFLWGIVAKQGQIYGNRNLGNRMNLSNSFWFSYPGYNEILTGRIHDMSICSNRKENNPNKNLFDLIKPKVSSVAAFGSWDVFPYILNEERTGICVNAGFRLASDDSLSAKEKFLNELQPLIPSRWSAVRYDAFTHLYAMEYLKKKHPSLVYIGYGETDDFAHEGLYDQYLYSANRTDMFISQLWDFICSDSVYKDKTTLIITTDHGRGNGRNNWKNHGRQCIHSGEVWLAVIGPDSPPLGEVHGKNQIYTSQIASSVLKLFGIDYAKNSSIGKPVTGMLPNVPEYFVSSSKTKVD